LALNLPTVIVTRGASVSDEILVSLSQRRAVILMYVDLTPLTLLAAVLGAYFGIALQDAPASRLGLPPRLLRAFLAAPRSVHRLADLARGAGLPVGGLRALGRGLGLFRFERLLTTLRAETWKWLVSAGVDRRLVEDYLGITDRSNFRRACRRAGIALPWGGDQWTSLPHERTPLRQRTGRTDLPFARMDSGANDRRTQYSSIGEGMIGDVPCSIGSRDSGRALPEKGRALWR
jgi:hypothetical protein